MIPFVEALSLFVVLPAFVGWALCKLFQPRTAVVQTAYAFIGALIPALILLLIGTDADSISAAATVYVAPAIAMLCLIPAAGGCAIGSPSQKK